MAYTKTNWVDNTTPVSAANLNKIEAGIEAAHNMAGVGANGYAANTSGTDAYTITLPNISSYANITGVPIIFSTTVPNSADATLNVNGLGAKSIVRGANVALVTGDIVANKLVEVVYDGTNFQLISQGADVVQAGAVQTLTNKTLTAPKLGSGGYIADVNGNELIKVPATVTNAVNEVTISNAATGVAPSVAATGNDTNIDLNLVPKGSGKVKINNVVGATVDDITASEGRVNSRVDLVSDIPDTIQQFTFDSLKRVSTISHMRDGTAVRTDTFDYSISNMIIETRALASGGNIIYRYNLLTLQIEVI